MCCRHWAIWAATCQCAAIGPLGSNQQAAHSTACCLDSGAWTEVSKARTLTNSPSMSMEAAAASSVGAEFGPALGFRNIHRRTLPYCWRPRSPRPASLSLCGGWGARPRGAIAAASGDQRRRQLGELEAEAEAGSALGPTRSSPREVTTPLLAIRGPSLARRSWLPIPAPWTHSCPPGLPVQVREEMARCFDLVRRLGRGAVYLGSSRVPPTHPHFLQTTELAREASSTYY